MKKAHEYKVNFGYGAKTTLNGAPYTHRGQDRPTPTGTPIVINGQKIGETGATGLVTGPHLHIQAGTDEWAQNTVNPSKYSFKPGTVTHTGTASQWGKHIIIKVGDIYVVYAHLSNINVKKGQIIKEDEMDPEKFKYGNPARNIYEWAKLALDYDKRIKEFQKEVTALKKQVQSYKKETGTVTAENNALQEKSTNLSKEVHSQKQANQKLEKELAQSEEAIEELKKTTVKSLSVLDLVKAIIQKVTK